MNKEKHIITVEECQSRYQEILAISKNTISNPYDVFIQQVKDREHENFDETKKPRVGVEKHHITPKFDGGSEDKKNLVYLTVKDHVFAHWLRWKVLNKTGDLIAYTFRVGDTDAKLAAQRQAVIEARERDKVENKGFYNSDFQTEMGLRGGYRGGSANTEEQFLARQNVGRLYGRVTGRMNQGSRLRDFLSRYSLWAFQPDRRKPDERFYLLSPEETFTDMAGELNKLEPNSINMLAVATMHSLVYGTRKRKYGWRIVDTLTRSQATDGVLEDED